MKRRPVVQSILLTEIQQREAVTKHQQPPAALLCDLPERTVQRLQLRQIRLQPPPVIFPVGRVGLTQRLADSPAQRHGLHWRCPDVLIVLDVLPVAVLQRVVVMVIVVMAIMVMVVAVIMLFRALHPLGKFLLVHVHLVHHLQPVRNVLSRRV